MSVSERRYYAIETGSREEAREAAVSDEPELTARLSMPEAGDATIRILPGDGRFLVILGERSAVGFAERRGGVWHVELEGRGYRFRVDDERTHELRALTAEMGPGEAAVELRAPMPGLVVRVAVEAGDQVSAGDPLVVMEAMKMENELRAESTGVVAEVHVTGGATVDRDDLLVTFELETT